MKFFRMCVLFIVLNLGLCNQIWSEPVDYWQIIKIIVLIILILKVIKSTKK